MKRVLKDIVHDLIVMPMTYEHANKSPSVIVSESGYFDSPDAVTAELLADSIKGLPQSVDNWLSWSENKRASSGWYLKRMRDGSFIVGYSPRTDNVPQLRYDDPFLACANFIKR